MNFVGIIPARYASTRFPGKPLAMIDGKSMIQRVYEQSCKANVLSEVWIATDDNRIENHIKSFGGKVMLTSPNHKSGTERCNEVIQRLQADTPSRLFDVAINIQGDEPFIQPKQIEKVASCFLNPEVEIATLIKKISDKTELFNPNVVKVITANDKKALYFSRQPIPFLRGMPENDWLTHHTYFKHIGIYAYRTETLRKLTMLAPSPLEIAESLEQLRWLENAYHIYTKQTDFESFSVDTPDDLLKLINNR
ncbi:MAG TPA: 3-deoxy-manno-octulosonate cytidylyltransferase [Bacteroidales bacterium]|nr:3-deoxy-manno-octulosonate cytidylyltransferase [Bacteroidales bacterium]